MPIRATLALTIPARASGMLVGPASTAAAEKELT